MAAGGGRLTMAAKTADRRVEKIMSASRDEFDKNLGVLLGMARAPRVPVDVAVGGGHVAIAFEALPPARLGGLLELPRARVTLSIENVEPEVADDFLRRFDLAFQRGGG